MTLTATKAERKRLAKAELILEIAITVQRWSDELAGRNNSAPFEQWSDDDPLVSLCRRYALTPTDLAKIAETLADQFEARAIRAGYDEAWIEVE